MAYRIGNDESIQESIRTVALEQIDKAIGEVTDSNRDRHDSVHQVRKRCKKIRGLIRLVRPQFTDYQQENSCFRDAARELSYVRDAQSIIECFDSLIGHFQQEVDLAAFARVRRELTERRRRIADDQVGLDEKLDKFLVQMRQARCRAAHWQIDGKGFSVVKGGLTKTYRRGRKAFHNAYDQPNSETFHEWRKRVKYHWYHTRLLDRMWTDMMKVWRRAAKKLSDLLGDDHDLAVLRATLHNDPERFGDDKNLAVLVRLIDQRMAELRMEARPWGERLFTEKSKQFRSRLGSYWRTWKTPNAFHSSGSARALQLAVSREPASPQT